MLQQFLLRWQIAALEVASVVEKHVWVADPLADGCERPRDSFLPGEIQLHRHAFAALCLDGLRKRRSVARGSRRQHDEEALLGKLLGESATDAPAYTDGQSAVIEHLAVRQFGVAAIGLPFGGCADHDGDLFTCWAHALTLSAGACAQLSRLRAAVHGPEGDFA